MDAASLLLSILLATVPLGAEAPSRTCAEADGVALCAFDEDFGLGRSTGASADTGRGVWVLAHHDEFDGFAGRSRMVLVEAGDGTQNAYWGFATTDHDADGLPDDACIVCGGVWDPANGYLVAQRLSVDGSGVHAAGAVRVEGIMRGGEAGVARGEPYARVFLV